MTTGRSTRGLTQEDAEKKVSIRKLQVNFTLSLATQKRPALSPANGEQIEKYSRGG